MRHKYAPVAFKDAVFTMIAIRSVALWSPISLLPNELLFEIFAQLDPDDVVYRVPNALQQIEHQHRDVAIVKQAATSSNCRKRCLIA